MVAYNIFLNFVEILTLTTFVTFIIHFQVENNFVFYLLLYS